MRKRIPQWSALAATIMIVFLLPACSRPGVTNPFQAQRTPVPVVVVPNSDPAHPARMSQNWAGYELVEPGVSSITATWQVPQVTGVNGDSSTWVGIGGDRSPQLIQAGTDQFIKNGIPSYYAWIETLPNPPSTLSELTILPGDTVTFTITEQKPGSWQIQATDHEAKQSTTQSLSYASCDCSAEWIEEAPSVNGHEATLADFASVTLTNCAAVIYDRTVPLGPGHGSAILMKDTAGNILAQPQTLQGDSFSVVYVATAG